MVPVGLAASLEQQREWYEQASTALADNDVKAYRQLRDKLDGYPLTPYLDYRYFIRRLSKKTPEQVEAFIADVVYPPAFAKASAWQVGKAEDTASSALSRVCSRLLRLHP